MSCKAVPVKLLVCGAGGMLGQDVVRAAETANHEVAGLDREGLDVTDPGAVRRVMDASAPPRWSTAPPGPTWTAPSPTAPGAMRLNAEAARRRGRGRGGGGRDRALPLHRLRVRRARRAAVRGVRPRRAASRCTARPSWRASRPRRQPTRATRGAHLLAVRRRRAQLRGDDAGDRRPRRPGGGGPRPGRRRPPSPATWPRGWSGCWTPAPRRAPHGRGGRVQLVRLRRGHLRRRRGGVPRALHHHGRVRPARAAPRLLGAGHRWPDAIRLPTGATACACTWRPAHEAAGHGRGGVHRVDVRAAGGRPGTTWWCWTS